ARSVLFLLSLLCSYALIPLVTDVSACYRCFCAALSAAAASPDRVREAIPCTKTGPIRCVAAHFPSSGMGGPSHTCRIRTCVPPGTGVNAHSTSIPFVMPPTCRKRMHGAVWLTDISESHHVGQLSRRGGFAAKNGWKGR